MDHICLKARAKINLALDVLGKRDDGYHDLRMILQTLELYDDVLIRKTDKFPLKIVSNLPWLPCDDRNLVYKAAEFILNTYNIQSGIIISLKKRIPVSAGLAGGSSDCAAALVGMRNLFGLKISDKELMDIGKYFGADVPYCVMRGTALAEGIGEKLTPLDIHPPVYVLLARPPVSVSTQMIFQRYKNESVLERPNIEKMIYNIKKKDLKGIASGFSNVLENVTLELYPVIIEIKKIMLECNGLGSLMSGSGPTVFGYFEKSSDACATIKVIKKRLPNVKDIYLTKIYNPISDRRMGIANGRAF